MPQSAGTGTDWLVWRLWGWRLIADNGNVISTDGGQGYEHESVAQKMAEQVVTGRYEDARPTRKGLHDKR